MATQPNTWTSNGLTYQFAGVNGGGLGVLSISGGAVGAGSIFIDNFNLDAAETSVGGYLEITLSEQIALESGAPQASPFSGGSQSTVGGSLALNGEATFTAYASASSTAAQTLTLSLSGGTAADYQISTGSTLLSFVDGQVNVTIAAGQADATFALVNVVDPGCNQTLQLTSSLVGASGATITSAPLTFSYAETPASVVRPIVAVSTATPGQNWWTGGFFDTCSRLEPCGPTKRKRPDRHGQCRPHLGSRVPSLGITPFRGGIWQRSDSRRATGTTR